MTGAAPTGRRYADRREAGRRLAEALRGTVGGDGVVVGLARGGVPVAAAVARSLGLPLDALAVRKIGHPLQPEYALGAVAPGGPPFIRDREGVAPSQLDRATALAARHAVELDADLHRERAPLGLAGRSCVLVDDGLATGATMVAAIRWARAAGAARVIAAAPVGAQDTLAMLEREADAVVCPESHKRFVAVGAWYEDFSPVEEEEVLALLRAADVPPG